MDSSLQIAFGGKSIQFLFPILYVWWFHREQVGVAMPTLRGMGIGLAFALAVGLGMFTLYYTVVQHIPAVTSDTPLKIHEKVKQFGANSFWGYVYLATMISGVHSLAEEYYWRWFVFGRMRMHMPMTLAIVLSSIGFMLHHIVILGVYFPGTSGRWRCRSRFASWSAAILAWLYARCGSLYAP